MTHREIGAVAPAVVTAEGGPVDGPRALRAAEDRDERGIAGRFALEPGERGAHRIAGEGRARKRRLGQRHGRAGPEAHAEAVGEPGRGVLFVHDDGHAQQARREHTRERRVAAEPDHDARPVATHDRDRPEQRRERTPERGEVLRA